MMATMKFAQSASPFAMFFKWLTMKIQAIGRSWLFYRDYMKSVNELRALSDRTLADLRIYRSAIPGIAYESALERERQRQRRS